LLHIVITEFTLLEKRPRSREEGGDGNEDIAMLRLVSGLAVRSTFKRWLEGIEVWKCAHAIRAYIKSQIFYPVSIHSQRNIVPVSLHGVVVDECR
jgi:hypothetical protein